MPKMPVAAEIDHALVLAADLGVAAGRFERLGFILTPRGVHTGQGTHNRCIMLEDQYLELIAVHAASETNRNWQDRLAANGEGLAAVALATQDEVAAGTALQRMGLGQGERLRIRRPIATPDGERIAEFGIARVATGAVPWLKTFFCRHYNRDLVWRPEWQRHPNGARRIAEIVAVDDAAPAAVAGLLGRLAGGAAVSVADGEVRAQIGGTTFLVLAPQRFADWSGGLDLATASSRQGFVGIGLAVDDLVQASRLIEEAGVFMVGGPDWIIVPPPQTGGVMLKLVDARR
jgi:hypothetical protein